MKKYWIILMFLTGILSTGLWKPAEAQPQNIKPDNLIQESFKNYNYIDTSYMFKFNEQTEKWGLHGRTLKYLGSKENPLLELNQFYDSEGATWKNDLRTIKSYDERGQEIQTLKQNWNDNFKDWTHVTLKTITYEGRKKSEILYQEWMKPAGQWINSTLYLIDYNDEGNEDMVVIKTYSVSTKTWNAETRYSLDYPAGFGKPDVAYVEKWLPAQKSWKRTGRYLLKHDFRGNKIMESRSTWNDIHDKWVHGLKFLMEYDKELIKKEIQQRWNFKQEQWINAKRNLYDYSEEGELKVETEQTWDEMANDWKTTIKLMYSDIKDLENKKG